MSKHLTPSEVIERIIGRPEVIGATIGADPKLAYSWRKGSKNRDPGDIPSARHMRALLAHAAAKGLPLVAEDLIWGISEEMLARRLAIEALAAGDVPGAFPADSSASSEQPEDCGGGGGSPAPRFFRIPRGHAGRGAFSASGAPRAAGGRGAPGRNLCRGWGPPPWLTGCR